MAFNPLDNFNQGFASGEQQKISGLQNALAGQMQQGGFDPSASTEFQQLSAFDPQKAAGILNTFTALDNKRQTAFFKDAQKGRELLANGDFEGFSNLLDHRFEAVNKLGGDPQDIVAIAQLFDSGDIEGTMSQLIQAERAGVAGGFLPDPRDSQIKDAQLANLQGKGSVNKPFKTADQIEREVKTQEGSLDIRREELKQRQLESGKVKLSPKAEKAIIDSQDAFFAAGETSRKMEILASDFESLNVGGGLSSTVTETFKDILGSQDEVTAARKRFNAIRSSQATSNLPPGPASDKDIALALSGFPKENANASQVLGFLRGQSKLARIDEKFNEFKAEFISSNNSVKGLIPAWKAQLNDSDFLDSVLKPVDKLKEIQQNTKVIKFDAQGNQI